MITWCGVCRRNIEVPGLGVCRPCIVDAGDELPELTPYYSADGITVYHARWEDVVAAGLVRAKEVALVHADPPYGVGSDAHRGGPGDGIVRRTSRGSAYGKAREYQKIAGNDQPFDPAPLLALGRPTVLWGANHYASRLPDSAAWFIWDKRDGTVPDDGSDAELAWTNLGGALRTFRHAWRGLARASETGVRHLHPTQKPIALSSWVFAHAVARKKLKRGDLVFVPYLGSGPDLPAAKAMGLRVVACEVEEMYCRTAVARLGAAPHPEPAEKLGPLFGGT